MIVRIVIVAIREGGVPDGSRLAIYQTLSAAARSPFRVARVHVCAIHPFCFLGSLRVYASYLSILSGIYFFVLF